MFPASIAPISRVINDQHGRWSRREVCSAAVLAASLFFNEGVTTGIIENALSKANKLISDSTIPDYEHYHIVRMLRMMELQIGLRSTGSLIDLVNAFPDFELMLLRGYFQNVDREVFGAIQSIVRDKHTRNLNVLPVMNDILHLLIQHGASDDQFTQPPPTAGSRLQLPQTLTDGTGIGSMPSDSIPASVEIGRQNVSNEFAMQDVEYMLLSDLEMSLTGSPTRFRPDERAVSSREVQLYVRNAHRFGLFVNECGPLSNRIISIRHEIHERSLAARSIDLHLCEIARHNIGFILTRVLQCLAGNERSLHFSELVQELAYFGSNDEHRVNRVFQLMGKLRGQGEPRQRPHAGRKDKGLNAWLHYALDDFLELPAEGKRRYALLPDRPPFCVIRPVNQRPTLPQSPIRRQKRRRGH